MTAGTLIINSGSVANTGTGKLLATTGGTLDLQSVTVTDDAAATVQVDTTSVLDLEAATINGGSLSNAGTVNSTGASFIHGAAITTSNEFEVTAGKLTIDATGGASSIANTGIIEAKTGSELDIDNTTVSSNKTLQALDTSTLVLNPTTVANSYGAGGVNPGTVNVGASTATLDLEASSITGGFLTNSGTVNSTGASALDGVATTTSDLLEVTAGTLIINSGSVANTGTGKLLATTGGTLDLQSVTVTDDAAATVQVDATSVLDLEAATINGGTVTNNGLLEATGGTSSTIENLAAGNFSNSGMLLVTGNSTTLVLNGDTLTNTGTVQVGNASDVGDTVHPVLDLVATTINGGTVTITNNGLLEASGGTSSTIENLALGNFSNNGTLLVTGNSTTLVLNGDTLTNTGTVQVGNASDVGDTVHPVLDLVTTTINGGTVNNNGLLEATGGANSTIKNLTSFTNNGTLQVGTPASASSDDSTSLVLLNDTVTNNGTVLVNPRSSSSMSAQILTLNLQHTIINGGTVTNHGQLEASGGTSSTIENISGSNFTSNGKLHITGTGTTLVLQNETLNNTFGGLSGQNGSVQIDANSTLDLHNAFINSHTVHLGSDVYGTITIAGLLEATVGTNAIHGAAITDNTGATLEATGASVALTIDQNSTLTNTGTLEAASGATLTLNTTGGITNNVGGVLEAVSGGTVDIKDTIANSGTIEAGDGVTTGTVVLEQNVTNAATG